jgi:hypothetical protein
MGEARKMDRHKINELRIRQHRVGFFSYIIFAMYLNIH